LRLFVVIVVRPALFVRRRRVLLSEWNVLAVLLMELSVARWTSFVAVATIVVSTASALHVQLLEAWRNVVLERRLLKVTTTAATAAACWSTSVRIVIVIAIDVLDLAIINYATLIELLVLRWLVVVHHHLFAILARHWRTAALLSLLVQLLEFLLCAQLAFALFALLLLASLLDLLGKCQVDVASARIWAVLLDVVLAPCYKE